MKNAEQIFNDALNLYEQNEYQHALSEVVSLIKQDPNNEEYQQLELNILFEMGDFNEVIKKLNYKITNHPLQSGLRFRRGLSYFQIGDFDKAIIDFDKEIEISDVHLEESFLWKGQSLFYLEKFHDAIEYFTSTLSINKNCNEALRMRAFCYCKLNMYSDSITALTNVIFHNPTDGLAYYNRGISYGNMGDVEKANKDLKIAEMLSSKKSDEA